MKFDLKRAGKGVAEWADKSYNICDGCEHGCLYCFARSQAHRYDSRRHIAANWRSQRLKPNRQRFGVEIPTAGVVMFPTTHDLTPSFNRESIVTVKNLVAKNRVLIVSKPHLSVITSLCRELADHKNDILFRFSIGALNPELCAFWEPGAPSPQERVKALRHAFSAGFETSVSIEPMLDERERIVELVAAVRPFVTKSIWIGKMQRIPRVLNADVKGINEAIALIKSQQQDSEILALFSSLRNDPLVHWKDSIRRVLEESGIKA